MTSKPILFTPQEATQRLPLIRVIVRDIMELKADVLSRQDRLQVLRELNPSTSDELSSYSEEVQQMEESLLMDAQRLDEFSGELQQLGVNLVDGQQGLVEFPAMLEDQVGWLSWMPDEDVVQFWRGGDSEVRELLPQQFAAAAVAEAGTFNSDT